MFTPGQLSSFCLITMPFVNKELYQTESDIVLYRFNIYAGSFLGYNSSNVE